MTDFSSHDDSLHQLSRGDQLALEWLLEHDLDPADAPPELSARAARLANLLLLAGDADVTPNQARVDAAFSRLSLGSTTTVVLSDADQDALDALMMAGLDASRVPSVLRERADRVVALTAMLGGADANPDAALTDRVMMAVDSSSAASEPERPVLARIGGRFADLISVAAVILIAASVIWPVMSTVRENAVRQTNQANLAVAGLGLGAYAADFEDQLPRVSDRRSQQQWWDVSPNRATSNASNMFALARLQYIPEQALRSPGNPDAPVGPLPGGALDWESVKQVSYSYLLPVEGHNEASAVGVVLADRSPIVLRLLAGQPALVSENSPNHNGQGQHMLRGDGSVIWTTEPYTQYGDHIYLPKPIEQAVDSLRRQLSLPIQRMPAPSHRADVFLGP